MSDLLVSVITLAIITMLVTRPGIATSIGQIGRYLSDAIRSTLGTS